MTDKTNKTTNAVDIIKKRYVKTPEDELRLEYEREIAKLEIKIHELQELLDEAKEDIKSRCEIIKENYAEIQRLKDDRY